MYHIVQMSTVVLIPDPVSVCLDPRQRTLAVCIYDNRCLLGSPCIQVQILPDKDRSPLQKDLISRLNLQLIDLSQTAERVLRCLSAVCIISMHAAHIKYSSHEKPPCNFCN